MSKDRRYESLAFVVQDLAFVAQDLAFVAQDLAFVAQDLAFVASAMSEEGDSAPPAHLSFAQLEAAGAGVIDAADDFGEVICTAICGTRYMVLAKLAVSNDTLDENSVWSKAVLEVGTGESVVMDEEGARRVCTILHEATEDASVLTLESVDGATIKPYAPTLRLEVLLPEPAGAPEPPEVAAGATGATGEVADDLEAMSDGDDIVSPIQAGTRVIAGGVHGFCYDVCTIEGVLYASVAMDTTFTVANYIVDAAIVPETDVSDTDYALVDRIEGVLFDAPRGTPPPPLKSNFM